MKYFAFFILILCFAVSGFSQTKKPKAKPTPPKQPANIKKESAEKTEIVSAPTRPIQKTCDLTLKDAPVLRGLKVNMNENEVAEVFGVEDVRSIEPYLGADVLSNGTSNRTYYDNNLKKYSDFFGIRFLELNFFGAFLHQISIKYAESYANFSDEELKKTFVEKFNLPNDLWERNSIKCKEFELSIDLRKITLTNLIVEQKITQAEEQKRKVFKP